MILMSNNIYKYYILFLVIILSYSYIGSIHNNDIDISVLYRRIIIRGEK